MGENIDEKLLDALRESFSIGAGHASTAFSQLTNKKVKVCFPLIEKHPLEHMSSLFGAPDTLVATVHLSVKGKFGDASKNVGHFLIILEEKDAINFTNILQQKKYKSLNKFSKDALKETGNILSGSCLAAISKFLDFELMESLPDISLDMLRSTLDSLLSSMAHVSDDALVFKSVFSIDSEEINSNVVFIFSPESYDELCKKINLM